MSSDALSWSRHVPALRARARAEVPRLTRHRRLPPSGRIAEVSRVLGSAIGLWYAIDRRRGAKSSRLGLSRRLRQGFERLGPTYIKLGQILSSGEGIFPEEVVSQFKALRDQVPAEPFGVVVAMLEEELAGPLSETFSELDPEPIAAAS
ncbi:MAG: AarF/UbiB family protein, partial [Acidimicrobiales bacterium]